MTCGNLCGYEFTLTRDWLLNVIDDDKIFGYKRCECGKFNPIWLSLSDVFSIEFEEV